MAYDFPASPLTGQVFQGWTYDGEKWVSTMVTPNQSGVIAIQVFTSSGTYTPSPSMTSCVVECQAGGGGGGGAATTTSTASAAGGGGGAGSYSRSTAAAASIGVSQTVTVAAGVAGGAAGANAGSIGGDTSVGVLCTAKGGSGGAGAASTIGGLGGSGGVAGTGNVAGIGAPGEHGIGHNTNGVLGSWGGTGASSAFGGGGKGAFATGAGSNSSGYGAGGGGGCTNATAAQPGGNGAPGLVVITEYGMTALSTSTTQLGAVRYDLPQGLTANQMAQARANINVTKRNYIINGAMQVSQENGTTSANTLSYYPADMFTFGFSNAGTQWIQMLAAASTVGASPNRIRVTPTVADATVAAGDYCGIHHYIEGSRVADLKMGTTQAKVVTLQFGVRGPAGTYCVSFRNNAYDRIYAAEYVIAAGEAMLDTMKSITVQLDTLGTWVSDNTGSGLRIFWCLMCGTTYQSAPNAWGATGGLGTANQFNFMGQTTNTFDLFDVSLTEGSVAPPFQVPDYASELAACKRYWQSFIYPTAFLSFGTYSVTGNAPQSIWPLPVEMRAGPTEAIVGTWTVLNCGQPVAQLPTPRTFGVYVAITATGAFQCNNATTGVGLTLNARL